MRASSLFVLGLACGAVVAFLPKVTAQLHPFSKGAQTNAESHRAHTNEKISFIARGLMQQVAPLFGALQERVWSPDWDPQFIYPLPPADVQGMVFTIAHHHRQAVWINTEFDLKNGRIQYAHVIPDAMVTLITLRMQFQGNQTKVDVEYDRTALTSDADTHVREMAKADHNAGPEWEKAINRYLEKHPAP
jgi:hypothetical protein